MNTSNEYGVVEVDLTAEPLNIPKALFLGEIPLISKGEIAVIVDLPSGGKSNVLEGIASAYARAKGFEPLDTLTFAYTAENATIGKKVLWIDTKQTNYYILFSTKPIKHRCQINADELYTIIDFYSFAKIVSATDMFKKLKALIETNKYDIVLIDGILDFCSDINNTEKATSVVRKLRVLAVQYNIAFVNACA